MTDCCVLVCILFHPEETLQSPNFSPAVLPCLHMLQFLLFLFLNPCQVRLITLKIFVDYPPPLSYDLHPEYQLGVNSVPFDCCIGGVTRMMSGLLMNMKRKLWLLRHLSCFSLLQLNLIVEARQLLCLEIDIHNEC